MLPYMTGNPRYAKYKIGRYTWGDPRVEDFGDYASLEIGTFTSFARGVTILLSGEHFTRYVTTFPLAHALGGQVLQAKYPQNGAKGDVHIGSDVWIGLGATILSGVTIGHGAVVGAGAVVAKDIEPYMIAVGKPARRVHGRFDRCGVEGVYERMLRIAWWDWPDERILEFLPLLMSKRIGDFLEKAEVVS